jgi:protein-L-isoaspartate(D-aspartate) O-methyltransferase
LIDTFKHKGQRARLAELLAEKGITQTDVLDAVRRVPRHVFVESVFADAAYEDKALPIAEGQTISQPFTVAFQTQLLAVKPNMKVLEIGTGSGYQAAVLCEMGVKLYSVEINRSLHLSAQHLLSELGYTAALSHGDGSLGWAAHQPFDRIIVTAASPDIPHTLKTQLAIGGKMVIPAGSRRLQQMCLVSRTSEKTFDIQRFQNFVFVPLIGRNGFAQSSDNS